MLVYQIPEASSTSAQPAVNQIKNGDGATNHAATAAPAVNAAHR